MDLLLLVDDGHRAVPRRVLGAARVDRQGAHGLAVLGHLHGVVGDRDIGADVVADLEGVGVVVHAVAAVAVADARHVGVDLHGRAGGPVRLRAPVGALVAHPVPGADHRLRGADLHVLLDGGTRLGGHRVGEDHRDRHGHADRGAGLRGDRVQQHRRARGLRRRRRGAHGRLVRRLRVTAARLVAATPAAGTRAHQHRTRDECDPYAALAPSHDVPHSLLVPRP